MKKHNISASLVRAIKDLYKKITSAVLFNGDWFPTTAGVWQRYLLSPTLFNIFLERIMTDAVEDPPPPPLSVEISSRAQIALFNIERAQD